MWRSLWRIWSLSVLLPTVFWRYLCMPDNKPEVITKTVWQHSQPLPPETMEFLRGIAADYAKVKSYVYGRYSGIKNVNRLTPYFAILTEARHCGLKERLNLPSAYYDAAVMEAIGNIKSMWGMLKNKLRDAVRNNDGLTADDCHYIRTVLKMNGVFAAVLNRQPYDMPRSMHNIAVDTHRLNNLLCRLVRRYLQVPTIGNADYFHVRVSGYHYDGGNLYLAGRMPRKRICLPLRDNQVCARQIQVHIREDCAAVALPVDVAVKRHDDYVNTLYVYIGYRDMCTLSTGAVYGRGLNELVNPETYRLNTKNQERQKMLLAYQRSQAEQQFAKAENIKANNLGKRKYDRQKKRDRERTQNFINAELNRMLRTEKPQRIVITKPVTKNRTKIYKKMLNVRLNRNFGWFIRQRLAYKCRVNGIELTEISSRGTGRLCSHCGGEGKNELGIFVCANCGFTTRSADNSARNIKTLFNSAQTVNE